MAVILHQGVPGSGKTLWLIQKVIVPALKQDNDHLIYTNIESISPEKIGVLFGIDPLKCSSKLKVIDFTDKERIQTFYKWLPENGHMAIDEGQNFFSNKDYRSENAALLRDYMTRHRHQGHNITVATPDISFLDIQFRKLAHLTYDHRSFSLIGGSKTVSYAIFNQDNLQGQSLQNGKWRHDTKCYDCYDTWITDTVTEKKPKVNVLNSTKLKIMVVMLVLIFGLTIKNIKKNGIMGKKNKNVNKKIIENKIKNKKITLRNEKELRYVSCIQFGDSTIYRLQNGVDTIAPNGTFKRHN